MSAWNIFTYGVVGFVVLCAAGYMFTRVVSLGYFRSKHEYDRTIINRKNGDKDA